MSFPPELPPRGSTRSGSTRNARDRRRRWVVIGCLVLVAALTACSTDGDDDSAATSTTAPVETSNTLDVEPDVTTPEGDSDPASQPAPDPAPEPEPEPGPDSDSDPAPSSGRELTAFERVYVGELSAAMTGMEFPASVDGTCVANAWVSAIGGERLEAAGISAEVFVHEGPGDLNLDRATAQAMHRDVLECGLTAEALVEWLVEARSGVSGCPAGAVTDELFEEVMVGAYMGELDDALDQQLSDAIDSCR